MSAPQFPPVDLAAWRARVEKELGDKPFEKLVQRTLEGVTVEPLYVAGSVASGFDDPGLRASRSARGSWVVTERVSVADPTRANALAREALADGAEALVFPLDAAGRLGVDRRSENAKDLVGKDGVAIVTADDVATLLSGVDLAATRVVFEGGASAVPLAALVEAAFPGQTSSGRVVVTMDAVGTLARDGELPRSLAELRDEAKRLALPSVKASASASAFHQAGASAVLELGLLLAAIVEAAEDGPVDHVEVFASSDAFLTIAKVRAVRLLHRKAMAASGRSADGVFVVGRTSPRRLAQRDPQSNMIRVTEEAFGLGVGGVDALVTSAFDEALGESDAMARRLARHTQLVLRDEAHLARVIDPAGGSYYLDALTDDLARKAWDVMREVEAEGGLAAALASGSVQKKVEAAREARQSAIAKRREIVVGVNEFALPLEQKLARPPSRNPDDRAQAVLRAERAAGVALPAAPPREALAPSHLVEWAKAGASLAALADRLSNKTAGAQPERAVKLELVRDAQRFEAIRDEADDLSSGGTRPEVVLACLGAPHEFRAREAFARRFFEVGGLRVVSIDSPEAIATKWMVTRPELSTADVVCLCSSDERYSELGLPAIRTIRSAYPSVQIVVAGRAAALAPKTPPARPGDPQLEKIDLEIFLGCDALAALASVLQRVRQRRRRAAATTRRLA